MNTATAARFVGRMEHSTEHGLVPSLKHKMAGKTVRDLKQKVQVVEIFPHAQVKLMNVWYHDFSSATVCTRLI